MSPPGLLFMDETHPVSLRDRVGRELATARTADFAVARIRLAHLDMKEEELRTVGRFRILLGQLDASTLLEAADPQPMPRLARSLERLAGLAGSGRLEVRSTGRPEWTPDFAVVEGEADPVGVLGAIYFGSPQLLVGPSFTIITTDAAGVRLLRHRFEELWARAHDVLPAIRETLERAHGMAASTAAGGGGADPV